MSANASPESIAPNPDASATDFALATATATVCITSSGPHNRRTPAARFRRRSAAVLSRSVCCHVVASVAAIRSSTSPAVASFATSSAFEYVTRPASSAARNSGSAHIRRSSQTRSRSERAETPNRSRAYSARLRQPAADHARASTTSFAATPKAMSNERRPSNIT